ncbi:MAG: hypothetical protein IT442_03750 [Phycisphaeraceae bacterium]|nr:hypothetical protein [Phycisphaeraceae bacterium]
MERRDDAGMGRGAFWSPAIGWVALGTGVYLVGALAAAIWTGNKEFVFYLATMGVIIGGILGVHASVRLPAWVLGALSVWGLAHMLGGLMPVPGGWAIEGEQRVLYSWWIVPGYLKYDHVVHAYGFGVATWVCWFGLAAGVRVRRATGGLVVLAALGGMGLGAMNEVVEFAATLLIPSTNVGGYVNTGWDLVSNMVGASVAAIGIWVWGRCGSGS